ncbi:HsdM N-terminal domain / N-6 DNA Methylase multi-domain protein [Lachnoanaerobaculum saburreum F0468]|uniref:site-specific DNA-methyltransferase (adenine-specific) n=1 Tax=Lachnoanaerobaculum saburreum F0468 TaxID=1095750 RepID=I0RA08_9FIRM|nr:class I SAM-dependent DNA methyltransferase [Lachnoanaerobaculum saburreum]EIC96516.1 HsdM N-terminal domain / N-6 DNA Methylase multi-domain protein [Lachnoanaerobaculum saburreum F0468]
MTGELKNKIDGLWEIFWTGGITNPLEVVEQMTYLMFIRDIDSADNIRAKEAAMLGLHFKSIFDGEVEIDGRKVEGEQLKWSVFHDFPAQRMYSIVQEWVFPFIKNLHGDKNSVYSKYMKDANFKINTPLMLSKIVDAMDEIYAMMDKVQSTDVRGDVYEYLLSKIAQSGVNGQFRTPRHIIKMMVEMMAPQPNETICDPACGTSGFLVMSGEYLKENYKKEVLLDKKNRDHFMNDMFYGFDTDGTMLRIGAMNMMTHGIENPCIEYRDSLSDQNPDRDKYSLILANPPFKGSLDAEIVSTDLLKVCKTKKTELLFLALFIRMLKIGGKCACIVPDGVLFGSSNAHKAIRKEIVENQKLEAVISMPSGVFKPYAGVSTGILIFTKTNHGGTDNVWFYDMTADGKSLDDKRTPIADNDVPDIIARFKKLDGEKDRKRTDKSFMVPKSEIIEKDYDLSINKYKEVEYVPVEYPPTSEILDEIEKLNEQIMEETRVLRELLKGTSN